MSKRDFHVTRRPDGDWQAKREGADRASFVRPTQTEAHDAAIPTAKREGLEIVTHRPTGPIRDSDSYGNDPNPPKDTKH